MKRSITLHEQSTGTAGRVDRENGIIRDVAILGERSANGRVYEQSALRKALTLYPGTPVRLDHRPGDNRGVTDSVGFIGACRLFDGKVRGDIQLVKSHPDFEQICERAEKFPSTLGLSHDAEGLVETGPDGLDHVVELVRVNGVDLVVSPATNKSLFEGMGSMTFRDRLREVVTDDRLTTQQCLDSVSALCQPSYDELREDLFDQNGHLRRLGLTEMIPAGNSGEYERLREAWLPS